MYIITGAAGFIASCLVQYLQEQGINNLVLVDDFSRKDKAGNWQNKTYREIVDRNALFEWLEKEGEGVQGVYHLGARTDTAEQRKQVFDTLNYHYSQQVWHWCTKHQVPLVYASSAATYGDGTLGYKDEHEIVEQLKPLNPYGISKNDFDKWALIQEKTPPYWYGLKFFNVYGPNEYHKGRMASVIFHAFRQIKRTGKVRLFRSHKAGIADGEQKRDFVYVKDVVAYIHFLMQQHAVSGLYNVGTGKAATFLDLARATFEAMGLKPQIEFIDTPLDIRANYQYFTQSDMAKMKTTNYIGNFRTLQEGTYDYVQAYLMNNQYW